MVRRFLVTVRIRRACGPPRVRSFVVHVARPAREWAAPGPRALVLRLVRSQRRGQPPHPRRPEVRFCRHIEPGALFTRLPNPLKLWGEQEDSQITIEASDS
nr:tumor suppressor ARF-like [Loxodonta africana]